MICSVSFSEPPGCWEEAGLTGIFEKVTQQECMYFSQRVEKWLFKTSIYRILGTIAGEEGTFNCMLSYHDSSCPHSMHTLMTNLHVASRTILFSFRGQFANTNAVMTMVCFKLILTSGDISQDCPGREYSGVV